MTTLATRLESTPADASAETLRALSDEMLRSAGWKSELIGLRGPPYRWIKPDGTIWQQTRARLEPPHPTGCLDDIVEMIPRGAFWGVEGPQKDGRYEAELAAGCNDGKTICRTAATPALALSAAFVRAIPV